MKRGFTLTELVIVLAIILVLAWVLFPVMHFHKPGGARRSSCQSNLKQIGLGFRQYTQDYHEKFPQTIGSVSGHMYGWADGLQPYAKSTEMFQCPSEATRNLGKDPRKIGYTDYWMNSRLAGVRDRDVKEVAATILAGEGNDGTDATDARYAIDELPAMWLNDTKSPIYRHLEGACYAFADGHVKWLKPEKIKAKLLAKDPEPTFAVR
jgi:prepilin-type N-terminal cleavage/methylation domain-containing protein/prepilin-type processing-associated H-X9-DG protein